jgi:hypothetical protein
MLDYIIRKSDNKLYVARNNQYQAYAMTFQKFINNMLLRRLSNLDALEKCSRKYFSLKSKIPLLLSKDILLLCVVSYRMLNSIYINYLSISKYVRDKNSIIVYFNSGHCLKINNVYAFLKQYKLARKIIDRFSDLDF